MNWEDDNRGQVMDGGDSDGGLRTGMRHAVAEVVAPLDLYEQVAGSARRRQRARVQVGAGAVVLALGAAVGVGVGDPFDWRGGDQADTAAPDIGVPNTGVPNLPVPAPATGAPGSQEEPPGTALTTCPANQLEASNPGVTQGAMLPDRPGKVLLCEYSVGGQVVGQTGTTLSAAASERFARMVNSLPQTPSWDGAVCLLGAPGQAVFFRNAAGNEAVLRVGGICFSALTDGRVEVPWDGRTPMIQVLG
ncbi:hypothetical protein OG216_12255 [Streptomycetaceae bacterium NBC_01309]